MKPWKDLSSVPMPPRVARMARDERGYPVPASIEWIKGKPDFRVIDPTAWRAAVQLRRCGICGETLGAHVAFVGGLKSIEGRVFTDLGMHRDCAEYALRVCPFLAMPGFNYARTKPDDVMVYDFVEPNQPDRFGLGITKGYEVRAIGDAPVLVTKEWVSVTWWKNGQILS